LSLDITVQFLGFESKPLVREYTFTVREPSAQPREFTLTIANEAFDTLRVRYQDAPDICSIKLRRELAAHANHPPDTRLQITEIDLEDYRTTHSPRKAKSPFARKPVEDF
jgi:hypothetical protein